MHTLRLKKKNVVASVLKVCELSTQDELNIYRVVLEEYLIRRGLPIDPYAEKAFIERRIESKVKEHYKRLDMSHLEDEIMKVKIVVRLVHKLIKQLDQAIPAEETFVHDEFKRSMARS
jgi:hypothetical protein